MKAAAESIIEIARDPPYVGATVGVLPTYLDTASSITTHMSIVW